MPSVYNPAWLSTVVTWRLNAITVLPPMVMAKNLCKTPRNLVLLLAMNWIGLDQPLYAWRGLVSVKSTSQSSEFTFIYRISRWSVHSDLFYLFGMIIYESRLRFKFHKSWCLVKVVPGVFSIRKYGLWTLELSFRKAGTMDHLMPYSFITQIGVLSPTYYECLLTL